MKQPISVSNSCTGVAQITHKTVVAIKLPVSVVSSNDQTQNYAEHPITVSFPNIPEKTSQHREQVPEAIRPPFSYIREFP
jgi:hypothetical protein